MTLVNVITDTSQSDTTVKTDRYFCISLGVLLMTLVNAIQYYCMHAIRRNDKTQKSKHTQARAHTHTHTHTHTPKYISIMTRQYRPARQ